MPGKLNHHRTESTADHDQGGRRLKDLGDLSPIKPQTGRNTANRGEQADECTSIDLPFGHSFRMLPAANPVRVPKGNAIFAGRGAPPVCCTSIAKEIPLCG